MPPARSSGVDQTSMELLAGVTKECYYGTFHMVSKLKFFLCLVYIAKLLRPKLDYTFLYLKKKLIYAYNNCQTT